MRVGDRDADRLDRRQPGRERPRVVLDKHAEKPLHRPEQRPVDHDRLLPRAVRRLVLHAEPLRLVVVELDSRQLPGAPDRVPGLHRDLRPVERGAAGIGDQLETGFLGGFPQCLGRVLPVLIRADELLLGLAPGGQLQVEVAQPVVAQQAEHERQQALDLRPGLLAGAEDVRVVHGQAAHPGQAVHHAGLLVPVDAAELEQPQRQLPVGTPAGFEDQDVERAVHRLEVVLRAFHLHRREHPVGEPLQVAGGLEHGRLGDVRGVHELVAGLLVALPRVVLHDLPDHPALGMEDREPAADLGREGEQVEFGAELAVITLLGLGEHLQVVVLRLPRWPGGAVDPLQLRVPLAPPPVRAAGPHQLERRDLPGGGQVRAAAQVLPAHLAGGRVEVVVDGELGAADLDRLVVGCRPALEPDELELVRLAGQFRRRLAGRDDPAREPLALLHDLAHPLLDRLQVIRGERVRHVEVVIEAVLDRGADAELRGEQFLHRLGQHVRGGVPQDRQAVRAADADRRDDVAVGQRVGEVPQLTGDPGGDHGAGLAGLVIAGSHLQRLAGRRARFHHVLASGEGDVKFVDRHWVAPWARLTTAATAAGTPMLSRRYRCRRRWRPPPVSWAARRLRGFRR